MKFKKYLRSNLRMFSEYLAPLGLRTQNMLFISFSLPLPLFQTTCGRAAVVRITHPGQATTS